VGERERKKEKKKKTPQEMLIRACSEDNSDVGSAIVVSGTPIMMHLKIQSRPVDTHSVTVVRNKH
jgi:hypothetical protein